MEEASTSVVESNVESDHEDTKWICKRCGHEATTKSNLIRHLHRQTVCDVTKTNITIEAFIEELTKKVYNDKTYDCEFCGTKFNSRSNKSRHKKTCKTLKKSSEPIEDEPHVNIAHVEPSKVDITQLQEPNLEIPQESNIMVYINALQAKNKILEDRLEQMERLIASSSITNNTNSSINTNNNNNNNNTTVTNNVTINVDKRSFGNEDISYLTTDFLSYCVLNPRKGIASLIENIHFNTEHPSNQNLRCKSFKQNTFEKYVGTEWRICDASNTLDELIKKGYRILNAHYMEHIMNDPNICDDENTQKIYEKFRYLGDNSCMDYFAVKRELRVLVKDRTIFLLASPDNNAQTIGES